MDNDTDLDPNEEDQKDDEEEEMAPEDSGADGAVSREPPDGWENPQTPEDSRGAPPVP
jgi:hypothetical protein